MGLFGPRKVEVTLDGVSQAKLNSLNRDAKVIVELLAEFSVGLDELVDLVKKRARAEWEAETTTEERADELLEQEYDEQRWSELPEAPPLVPAEAEVEPTEAEEDEDEIGVGVFENKEEDEAARLRRERPKKELPPEMRRREEFPFAGSEDDPNRIRSTPFTRAPRNVQIKWLLQVMADEKWYSAKKIAHDYADDERMLRYLNHSIQHRMRELHEEGKLHRRQSQSTLQGDRSLFEYRLIKPSEGGEADA